ncbi:hypothetical protein ACI78V_17910 [Geodermatophilus sp. SYSU D00742]
MDRPGDCRARRLRTGNPSLLIVAVNSAAGFAAHAGEATLNVPVTLAFTAAAVAAALPAGRLATHLDTARLRRWFA